LKRALAGCLFSVLLGCSRPESAPAAGSQPNSSAKTPRAISAAPSLVPSSALTPPDVEDDAAQHITEQNLESELDRLEREIQAE
jgi:hypothetical protein